MKTLFKLLFIATVASLAIFTYHKIDTPITTIENAEALAQEARDLFCTGTGNVDCNGKWVNSKIHLR
ncbi:MAG: hypothetical protein LUG51_15845 [Tannerellaceae bacterium]|nr:hypothetical protein [Tannerellaceae bacterium]